jgi:hypothetical protein
MSRCHKDELTKDHNNLKNPSGNISQGFRPTNTMSPVDSLRNARNNARNNLNGKRKRLPQDISGGHLRNVHNSLDQDKFSNILGYPNNNTRCSDKANVSNKANVLNTIPWLVADAL